MQSHPALPKICSIIVTYHPDAALLKTLLEKLRPQVQKLLIVNNTATSELETQLQSLSFFSEITIINPSQNIGLGAAYNRGIQWAKKSHFEDVLLFDQDSCPANDMVFQLTQARAKIAQTNPNVAVVGPNHTDIRTHEAAYAVQLSGYKIIKCFCSKDKKNEYIPAAHIISSGSLIALKDFDAIGAFDEGLFIDYIDTEWTLRALSKGYLSYYICPAILYHRLGENLVTVFGRSVPFYSPLRCFYLLRNAILLCKKTSISFPWKVRFVYQCLQRYAFYTIRSTTKWQHIKMMSLGVWRGLVGKTGKY